MINKGTVLGIGSGLFWGIDGFLISLILSMAIFQDVSAFYIVPLVGAALHDGFAGIWLLAYNVARGKGREYMSAICNKTGLVLLFSSLLGGPFAMSSYLVSIYLIGPCYASIITASYPVLGAIFSAYFLHERIRTRLWAGILSTVIGVIILNYSPTVENTAYFYTGIAFAGFAAIGWALEGTISTHAMKKGIDPDIAIGIREITSFSVYILFILPFISGGQLFQESLTGISGIYMAITALIGSISYLMWYRSMRKIGVGRAMTLNITYAFWIILLNLIFMGATLGKAMLLGSLFIITGAAIVLLEDVKPLDKLDARSIEKY